jgi:hypothetical protein
MQNVQFYKRARKDFSLVNENYSKVMSEYAKLSYLFDPTSDKQIYDRLLMDITIGSTLSTYDPGTATLPYFANIPANRRQLDMSGSFGGSFGGTHFAVSTDSVTKAPFFSAGLQLQASPTSGMFQQLLIMNTPVPWYKNALNSTDHQYSPYGYNGYWMSSFGYTANNNILIGNELSGSPGPHKIVRYNNSPVSLTDLVNGVTVDTTSYYIIVYDGYLLWIGRSSTLNNPSFTWYKIGLFDSLFPANNPHITLIRHCYRSTYLNTTGQNMILSSTSYTGALPWN